MSLETRKTVFGGLRTTKAQTYETVDVASPTVHHVISLLIL